MDLIDDTTPSKPSKEKGILKLDTSPRLSIESRYELTPQGSWERGPSVDRQSVTWADPEDSMSSPGGHPYHLPTEGDLKYPSGPGDGSEDEDYSASISAVLRQRRASVRRSRKGRGRRPSSPFLPDDRNSRRRSSAFTTSSGDTAISMEECQSSATQEQIFETISMEECQSSATQEQIFENIHLHKEVLSSVKQQPLDMRRKLKIVMQAKAYIKRHEGQLQERLAQSKSTRDIYARFNILLTSKLHQLRREAANMSNLLVPWELRIKEIESHFGSVVASYFTFLRWLFWVNLVIGFILLVFVIVPEYLTANPDEDGGRKKILEDERRNATNLLTLWEFEGVLKFSAIFYGFYSNIERSQYRMPLAYFLTGLVVYIYSFVATLRKMAENSRMSKLSEKEDECVFSWKLFTGWDFMIGNAETAHNRIASVILGFKEALLEEAEKKKDLRNWRVITLRAFVNVCVVLLLAVSAFAVVNVVSRSDDNSKSHSWWRENETTIVVTIISITFPVFFELLGLLEHYHPRKQLRLQLARIMLLNLLNLYSLIFALFSKIDRMSDELNVLKPRLMSETSRNVDTNETVLIVVFTNCTEVEFLNDCLFCDSATNFTNFSSLFSEANTSKAEITKDRTVFRQRQNSMNDNNLLKNFKRREPENLIIKTESPILRTNTDAVLSLTEQMEIIRNIANETFEEDEGSESDEMSFEVNYYGDYENNDKTYVNITNLTATTGQELLYNYETFNSLSSDTYSTTSEISESTKDIWTDYSESTDSTVNSENTENIWSVTYSGGGYVSTNSITTQSTGEKEQSDNQTEKTSMYSNTEQSETDTSPSSTPTDYDIFSSTEAVPRKVNSSETVSRHIILNCSTKCDIDNLIQTFVVSNCFVSKQLTIHKNGTLRGQVHNFQNMTRNQTEKNSTIKEIDVAYRNINGVIMYNLSITTKKKLLKLCWETMFGQELVKLTMMDLVFVILGTLFMDFFRALFVRYMNRCWCWDLEKKFPEYGDFKIAENILHLINNQGMVWMGMFFSPGLVVLNVFKLVIMMYLRSWTVMTCNVPHEVVFRVSKSNNFYLGLLLTMLFLCVLPVGYSIVWVKPSWHCGPFSEYDKIYYIVTKKIYKIFPRSLNFALQYIASPAIVIPLLVLLILIIYYLTSLTNSLREANNDLKIQLRRERTEERRKVFQIADTRRRVGSAEMDSTPFARWKKALPSLPLSKSIDSDDRKPNSTQDDAELKTKRRKKGGIFAKIVNMALDRRTEPETDLNNQMSISPNADDETDTDFHETLPKEILEIKDIQLTKDSQQVKHKPRFEFKQEKSKLKETATSYEKYEPGTSSNEEKVLVYRLRKEMMKKSPIKSNLASEIMAEETEEVQICEEDDNLHKMLSKKQTSDSSAHTNQSDSIGSVIPVITISTTESDDEMLQTKDKKTKVNLDTTRVVSDIQKKTESTEKLHKKRHAELKFLRRQSSVDSINEQKPPKAKKSEDGHKYQYSL